MCRKVARNGNDCGRCTTKRRTETITVGEEGRKGGRQGICGGRHRVRQVTAMCLSANRCRFCRSQVYWGLPVATTCDQPTFVD
jgi:hypothetical protein